MSLFIAFEGPDGVGKSTQVAALSENLKMRGSSPVTVSDPGTTDLGSELRRLLLDKQDIRIDSEAQALLFLAAKAQLWAEIIEPALEANQIVITDRWHLSTMVYQGMLQGDTSVDKLLTRVLGKRRPDLNIVLIGEESKLKENVDGVDRFESSLEVGYMNYCYNCVEGLEGDLIYRYDTSIKSVETTSEEVLSRVLNIVERNRRAI